MGEERLGKGGGASYAFMQPATLQRALLSQFPTISQLHWVCEGNIREHSVVTSG